MDRVFEHLVRNPQRLDEFLVHFRMKVRKRLLVNARDVLADDRTLHFVAVLCFALLYYQCCGLMFEFTTLSATLFKSFPYCNQRQDKTRDQDHITDGCFMTSNKGTEAGSVSFLKFV